MSNIEGGPDMAENAKFSFEVERDSSKELLDSGDLEELYNKRTHDHKELAALDDLSDEAIDKLWSEARSARNEAKKKADYFELLEARTHNRKINRLPSKEEID